MTLVPSTPAPVVLIVDDSATNLHVLNRILGARYQVKVARSGLKALDIAVRVRPSLILLDVQMPDMDGIEVCRRLKQDSATAAIPVAFVSGDGGARDLAACRAAGGSDFFIKPVDPEDLLARAARLIGR
jgi:putative two-component system response regulator